MVIKKELMYMYMYVMNLGLVHDQSEARQSNLEIRRLMKGVKHRAVPFKPGRTRTKSI